LNCTYFSSIIFLESAVKKMKNEAEITVIGAGVVGLAIAAEVASQDQGVLVIEKNESFG
jgi:ribulose 1,5-bisphosphate synthetase/thiazole synthase